MSPCPPSQLVDVLRIREVHRARVTDPLDANSGQVERALIHARAPTCSGERLVAEHVRDRGVHVHSFAELQAHTAGNVLEVIDLAQERADHSCLRRKGLTLLLLELLESAGRLQMLARAPLWGAAITWPSSGQRGSH